MKFSTADKVAGAMVLALAMMVVASGVREDFLVLSAGTAYNSVIFKADTAIMGTINATKIDYWSGSAANCRLYGIKDGGAPDGALYSVLGSSHSGMADSDPRRFDGVNYGELVALANYVTNLNMHGQYISLNNTDGKRVGNKLTFYDASDGTSVNTNCCMYGTADNTLTINAGQVDMAGAKVINVGRGTLGPE